MLLFVLAPFETSLRLHWVNDVADNRLLHWQRDSFLLLFSFLADSDVT